MRLNALNRINSLNSFGAKKAGQDWSSYWATRIPSDLVLTVVSDTQIDGSFTINGAGQDGHKVYISTDNLTFTLKDTLVGSDNTFQATGLSVGTFYYFYIKAYKGTNESNATDTENACTSVDSILTDGNTVGQYIASDLTTITKNGSNVVLRWNDKLGSGNDFTDPQNNAVWSATEGMTFNGTDRKLKTGAFTLNQPVTIYMVMKQVSWTSTDDIIDGNTNASLVIQQGGSSPQLLLYAGTKLQGGGPSIGEWGIVRAIANGANSKIQINDETAVAGNAGTQNAGAIALGCRGALNEQYGNINVKELIYRKVADSDGDYNKIFNYLSFKYGFFF